MSATEIGGVPLGSLACETAKQHVELNGPVCPELAKNQPTTGQFSWDGRVLFHRQRSVAARLSHVIRLHAACVRACVRQLWPVLSFVILFATGQVKNKETSYIARIIHTDPLRTLFGAYCHLATNHVSVIFQEFHPMLSLCFHSPSPFRFFPFSFS